MKKNIYVFVLFIVFIGIVFLRFWKVPQIFYFGIDEEYQSLLALSIIKDFHVIWIGLSAANTGFYIGPGLVYLHSFLLWFTKGDPIILAYTASLIGTATTIVLFFVVKNLFNKKVAILTSIVYGLSSFIIVYDRRFWNSTLVPLTAILFFYSLVKFKKNSNWIIFIAFLLGLSFHIHASLFIFIPITITTLYYYNVVGKFSLRAGRIVLGALVFLAVYSPLVVFDLVHNFDNLKTPFRLLTGTGRGGRLSMIAKNIDTFQTTISRFWLNIDQPVLLTAVLFFVSVLVLIKFLLKKKTGTEKVLLIVLAFYLLMFIFYPGKLLDYYLLGFLPFFTLVCGLVLQKVNKYLLIIFIGIYVVINSVVILDMPINKGLTTKKNLIKQTLDKVKDRSFSLETNHEYLYFGGWRYLFEVYGKRPEKSQADEMFGWIYPNEITQEKPKLKVIVSDNEISTKEKPITVVESGIFKTYVFEEVEQ